MSRSQNIGIDPFEERYSDACVDFFTVAWTQISANILVRVWLSYKRCNCSHFEKRALITLYR